MGDSAFSAPSRNCVCRTIAPHDSAAPSRHATSHHCDITPLTSVETLHRLDPYDRTNQKIFARESKGCERDTRMTRSEKIVPGNAPNRDSRLSWRVRNDLCAREND